MDSDEDQEVAAVAAGIAEHLRSHPNAADSARGVARWWLGARFAKASPQQVEQALDLLVVRGEMQRLKLMDGTFLYSEAGAAKYPRTTS